MTAPQQEIKKISVENLCLWSENPRDPIETAKSDEEIIDQAIVKNPSKWNLKKMAKSMGEHYDYSEIPTVVKLKGKYVVFDGNRRIALLKCLQDEKLRSRYEIEKFFNDDPVNLKKEAKIPCNLCDKDTALLNIERKHVNSGTWGPLERDYFLYRHRNQKKSLFIQFEEQTGNAISANKKMNQGFVKKEVLTENNLKKIGFHQDSTKGLVSHYDQKKAKEILQNIVTIVNQGGIDTRGDSRGDLKTALINNYPELETEIQPYTSTKGGVLVDAETVGSTTARGRKTPRQKEGSLELFGKKLSLKRGKTNDVYRDVVELYDYYRQNQQTLSSTFPALIRMSLRLLVETAAEKQKLNTYIQSNFDSAKNNLSKDNKTTLSNYKIDKKQLVQLLQTGAHNYTSSTDIEKTKAMSIIIGEILLLTHGR